MSRGEAWRTARQRAHAAGLAVPSRVQACSLADSFGRVLAEPVTASCPLPGFDTAAMDGYAVRGDQPWRVVGRTLAGQDVPAALGRGEAREIATGAATPPQADAVVPYERAAVHDDLVTAGRYGVNIRRAGEEAAAGELLVPVDRPVTPAIVALAAAAGYDELVVRPRPRVAAVVTGDELLAHGVPTAGRVRDAIGPALPGWVSWSGGALVCLDRVPDVAAGLSAAIEAASAEIVLVTGSSSAGQADFLDKCVHDLGASPVVEWVECTPGRTQSMWTLPDGRLLIGLPGNPFAALVAYLTLVGPACVGLLGAKLAPLESVAHCDAEAHQARVRLVPVTVSGDWATECGYSRSAMLRGVALADALAVLEPGHVRGTRAELVALPGAGLSGERQ
jgi:molybdopterin molybdotransferase